MSLIRMIIWQTEMESFIVQIKEHWLAKVISNIIIVQ